MFGDSFFSGGELEFFVNVFKNAVSERNSSGKVHIFKNVNHIANVDFGTCSKEIRRFH